MSKFMLGYILTHFHFYMPVYLYDNFPRETADISQKTSAAFFQKQVAKLKKYI